MKTPKLQQELSCGSDAPTCLLFEYDGMLWTRCKLRKTMPDYFGGHIAKGRMAYRPLTNGYDRMKRLEAVPISAKFLL